MEKLDRKSRLTWIGKGINRITRARSRERDEDDKRDPHKIPSPFGLEAPHTHQDSDEATQAPATFLACATQRKEGGDEELMGIKSDKRGKKGYQRVVIICKCKNPSETDKQRQAVAQEIKPGEKPVIPQGSHLVSSSAVFLQPSSQQQPGKTVFLLQITHPAINQNTPKDLQKSAGQALANIKKRLELEDHSHTADSDNKYFQTCMSSPPVPSAPPYEEIVKQEQEQEQGAVGGALPYEEGDKIPGAQEDQDVWINPDPPAKQGPDKTEHMIIIHKKESSQNKQTLKFLANEQLTRMGWSNLKFPDRSQEIAKDAMPDDIWGYVLRNVQEDNNGAMPKGAMKGENKAVTFASFIKKDYQNIWMNKAFKTYNLSSDLEMTLLISNANEDPSLNDLKIHFGKWDEGVMAFLYATIDEEEKKRKGDLQPEQQQDDILEDMRRAEKMENDRRARQEGHRLEHERQMAEQKAEFERVKKENNDKLDDLYKEVDTIERVIRHSRLQSRRLSRVASSLSSRAPSPTESSRETLRQAKLRLKQLNKEKDLKGRQQSTIDRIMDMEVPKKERMSAENSADEDAAWIESEEEIPLHDENHEEQRKKEKIKFYRVQMKLKESRKPEGHYVCPDGDCIYTSSREEKIPNHVLNHHGKQGLLVEQALLEQLRIEKAQQDAKENQKTNKIKLEQEEREEKIQKQMGDLKEALKLMEEKEKKLKLMAEQAEKVKETQLCDNSLPVTVKKEVEKKSNQKQKN